MLADLLPLMTDTVRQLHAGKRDLFGKTLSGSYTEHRARVTHSPGSMIAQASRERAPDSAATVWLIDHPHPIAIGDTFELPNAAALKVVRFELRTVLAGIIHKVYMT